MGIDLDEPKYPLHSNESGDWLQVRGPASMSQKEGGSNNQAAVSELSNSFPDELASTPPLPEFLPSRPEVVPISQLPVSSWIQETQRRVSSDLFETSDDDLISPESFFTPPTTTGTPGSIQKRPQIAADFERVYSSPSLIHVLIIAFFSQAFIQFPVYSKSTSTIGDNA